MSARKSITSVVAGLVSPLQPPQSPLQITEIMMQIFSNLDGPELVRVSLVCASWRATVEFCRKTTPFAFKFPVQFTTEIHSHFEEPCKAYKDMEQKYRMDRLKLEEAGNVSEESIDRIRPPIFIDDTHYGFIGTPVLDAMRLADVQMEQFKNGDTWANAPKFRTHYNELHYIRASFKGVRLGGSGWPVGLREIHCNICEKFHTRFHFGHLHPALRFLEETNICIRGQGTTLRIQLDLFNEQRSPRSCYEHYCEEMIEFAGGLNSAMNMIGPGGCGQEFFSRPITNKIIVPDSRIIEDAVGLNLAAVVPFLVEYFHRHISRSRITIHKFIPVQYSWYHNTLASSSTDLHIRAAYNDSEDEFTAHKEKFPQIVELVEQAIVTVDEVMSGAPIWPSISASEVNLEQQRRMGEYGSRLIH